MIDMLRKLSGIPETAPSTHLSLQQNLGKGQCVGSTPMVCAAF